MGKIFVISGPSGSGKNTVYDELLKLDPTIAQTVSATTRCPREGEVNGVDYYFVSDEEFDDLVARGEFIEYVRYGGHCYGTLKKEVKRLADQQKKVVLIIDVIGALNFKDAFPEAETIFLLPPSEEELARRLRGRGTDSEDAILRRLNIAKEEMKNACKYDHRVVNGVLADCVHEVYTIMNKD